LTDIELRLVSRITDLFLAELQKAWHNVVSLELSVEQIESNPQLVQLVPPSEVVVVVSFELMISDVRGMINLCIPFNAIERISSKLAANSWFTAGKSSPSDESIQQLSHRLGDATMELVVTLAKTKITTSDLLELRVGDIITTEQDARGALEVSVAGVPKFAAKPGAYRGRKAFQVTRVLGSGQK
jgi:flagellar motor switch protein FliM